MIANENMNWDAKYDVVVLGFGGAGATAARHAADEGAKVLLVDSAPEGHEGGNTRYSAQLIGTMDNFEEGKKYYNNLLGPMNLDEEINDTYVQGMVNIPSYVKEYLEVEPVSVKRQKDDYGDYGDTAYAAVFEFPELEGGKTYDMTTVQNNIFDAAFWNVLKAKVVERLDQIDVWYSSPAKHLIRDQNTKTVLGVQIERDNVPRNIRARNGVVLATGGFENNKEKVQDYLGAPRLVPLGTTYNKGVGIDLAIEAGADLWHMHNYESLGLQHGLAFLVEEGERGNLVLAAPELNTGSVVTVGDDGSRYFKEDEGNRHGHIYHHGTWVVPHAQVHPHIIFDQSKYDEINSIDELSYAGNFNKAIKADSLEELANLINADPEILTETIQDYNFYVDQGKDYSYKRNPENLGKFGKGPYYAMPVLQTVLNTQGGPRRNAQAEVLDTDKNPIPQLYVAGELGGVCAGLYQGGGNLAECLIFGKIAGENAAKPKSPVKSETADEKITSTFNSASDINKKKKEYPLKSNQALGYSNKGMGGEIIVRITKDNNEIKSVEVLEHSESKGISDVAIKKIPDEIVQANSTDVDTISGATVTSKALIEAVDDALK